MDPTKTTKVLISGAVFGVKNWPTWLQVGVQNRRKTEENRCKNRLKNGCLLGSIFERILVDFWRKYGGMLAPKSEAKSMLPLKRKNQLNASPLAPNWVRGVQVGSKNRSKNGVKMGRHLGIDF